MICGLIVIMEGSALRQVNDVAFSSAVKVD